MGPSFTASEDILYYSRIICRSSECTGACGDIESHFVPSSVTFCPFAPSSTPTPRRRGSHHHYHGIYSRDGRFSVHRHSNRARGCRRNQIRHRLHTVSSLLLHTSLRVISNSKRDLCLTLCRHTAEKTKPGPANVNSTVQPAA